MKEQMLSLIKNSKDYTLSVANAMPDESYDFKPAGPVMSFKEQLNHLTYGITWYEENYLKGNKTSWEPAEAKGKKKDFVKRLDSAYESITNTIKNLKVNDDHVKGFYAALDHITHHRAQAIVYLRCKGIAPPEYLY